MKWYEVDQNNTNGVVISSRIRLARNLNQYPFPNRISDEEALKLIQEVREALFSASSNANSFFEEIPLDKTDQVDKLVLMERHVISPFFINVKKPNGLILSKDESVSIMINEEDHLRIQSLKFGMNLYEAMDYANKVDDLLEEKLRFAFDDKLGYLTACPTNLGTGLRASYMIHVPALESTGQLQFLLDAIGKFGLTVRGIYGEGTEALGSIFQISNQVTLGMNEQEIMDNLTSVTKQIIEQELITREKFIREKRMEFEDGIYRSYGILSHARVLTSKEAMNLLSDIKLGFELGILKSKEEQPINILNLMTCIQPANLQKLGNKNLSVEERDVVRAKYIRENIIKLV